MDDAFGDRMKRYEMEEAGRKFLPLLPIVARLDGKGFSQFTEGLARPYDARLSAMMVETVKHLVFETNAVCGYTQSDEITLGWYSPDYTNQLLFDGRIQKLNSVLAAKCSVKFVSMLAECLPEKKDELPVFDCRVWALPNLDEATNCFLWREFDATKNSISMAASHYYKHGELQNKSGSEKQEMLWQKGVNWNNYPTFFKRGTYVKRKTLSRVFTVDEVEKLPPLHSARKNPALVVERNEVTILDLPPLNTVVNRVDVIFGDAEPATLA